MTTIQIKHRYTGDVLYECEAPQWMEPDLHMRYALEKAVAEKKSLRGAHQGACGNLDSQVSSCCDQKGGLTMIAALMTIGVMCWLAMTAIVYMAINWVSFMPRLVIIVSLAVCGIAFLFYISWIA